MGLGEDPDFRGGFWKDSNMNPTFFFIQHQSTPLYLPLLSQLVGACRLLYGNRAMGTAGALLERVGIGFSALWAGQRSSCW